MSADRAWMADAACVPIVGDWDRLAHEDAISVCHQCPVLGPCRKLAATYPFAGVVIAGKWRPSHASGPAEPWKHPGAVTISDLWRLRLDEAIQLLDDGVSVTETAKRTGYALSGLASALRRHTDRTDLARVIESTYRQSRRAA